MTEGAATCIRCRATHWVCEAHDDHSWDGEHACGAVRRARAVPVVQLHPTGSSTATD
jgi:hypothetical protein